MIMHIFADWGNTGQNMAESLGITTVSTTKAHGGIGIKAKVWGEILSSKGLLRDEESIDKIISKVKRFSCYGQ
jgi:hypothetical protein